MARKSTYDECQDAHDNFRDGVREVEGPVVGESVPRIDGGVPILSDDITYNPRRKRRQGY